MGKQRSCANCLWCWPEIHGEDGYRCYKPNSPSYHRVPTVKCDAWEVKATPTNFRIDWGDNPKLQHRKSKKGWYE